MNIVPKVILIGLALYIIALVDVLWEGGMFAVVLGAPLLLYQGFLLYQIFKRQNWARIALLIFVVFVFIRALLPYGNVIDIGNPPTLQVPVWATLAPLAHFGVRLVAVICFFARPASRWFLSADSKTHKEGDATGLPAETPRIEASNFGFGSMQSIGRGMLVAGIAIGAFLLVSQGLQRTMPTTWDTAELKPEDADYPAEITNPTDVIALVAPNMELSNYQFNAGYSSDMKRCGRQVGLGGIFAEYLHIPIKMERDQDGTYRGSFALDQFQPGKCGWKFQGVAYTRPDGVGNAVGVFTHRQDPSAAAVPDIDMWCYRVTEGQFKSPDPKCEILAELRWPSPIRRASPEFLAKFSHDQLSARGWAAITTETKELNIEFHDLNAIPGALVPVGDEAAQLKAADEAIAAQEASPEGQASKCFERANHEYGQTHPPPDTATNHTQRDTVLALKNKCRADFGLAPEHSQE